MTHLAEHLAVSGTKQSAIAAAVGVSRSFMSELVAGKKRPSRSVANAIERFTQGAVTAASWDDLEGAA